MITIILGSIIGSFIGSFIGTLIGNWMIEKMNKTNK